MVVFVHLNYKEYKHTGVT